MDIGTHSIDTLESFEQLDRMVWHVDVQKVMGVEEEEMKMYRIENTMSEFRGGSLTRLLKGQPTPSKVLLRSTSILYGRESVALSHVTSLRVAA